MSLQGDLAFSCSCGHLGGSVEQLGPRVGSRNSCCCASCQRFFEVLGREDELDSYGGTEVLFLPMDRVRIHRGSDQLRCLHLSRRGLFRWYTECCRSPIGNCMAPPWPFFSVITTCVDDRTLIDGLAGNSLGYVNLTHARRPVPRTLRASPPRVVARAFGLLARWRLGGHHRPSAFFSESGEPVSQPRRLDAGESLSR